MAEPLVPVMAWPFRMVNNSSQIPFVEQDSPEEIQQSVAMVYSVRQGDLVDEPDLGLTDPTFKQGGVTEGELVAAARQWEPRAAINFTRDELVGIAQTVNAEVSNA